MGTVSVIFPACKAAATLPRTLAALDRQELAERFDVVVVDDASSDDTARLAEARGARVVRDVPEFRSQLTLGAFLPERTLLFDVGVAGVLAALGLRRASPAALASDAVAAASLLTGSLRSRRVVL